MSKNSDTLRVMIVLAFFITSTIIITGCSSNNEIPMIPNTPIQIQEEISSDNKTETSPIILETPQEVAPITIAEIKVITAPPTCVRTKEELDKLKSEDPNAFITQAKAIAISPASPFITGNSDGDFTLGNVYTAFKIGIKIEDFTAMGFTLEQVKMQWAWSGLEPYLQYDIKTRGKGYTLDILKRIATKDATLLWEAIKYNWISMQDILDAGIPDQ